MDAAVVARTSVSHRAPGRESRSGVGLLPGAGPAGDCRSRLLAGQLSPVHICQDVRLR